MMTMVAEIREVAPPRPRRSAIPKILVVDDEVMILQALRRLMDSAGYEVAVHERPVEALEHARREKFDVALVDLRMDGMTGIDFLERIKAEQPDVEVVMMTAYGTPENAFRAVKLGAYDWLKKPFENIDEVAHVVAQALEHRRLLDRNRYLEQQVSISERFEDLIGRSVAMREVFELVESAAPSDASILIHGESGTGKELIARAIHRRSPRALQPMVTVHCGAIAETLPRVGAVRAHPGLVHRREPEPKRALRGRRRRHHLPGRDRGDEHVDASQIAARPARR